MRKSKNSKSASAITKYALLILLFFTGLSFAQNPDALLERANQLYTSGRYGQAILLYRKAETRGADPLTVSFNIANCLFQEEKFPESIAAYRKAVDVSEGTFAPALFNLASVLFRIGEYPESIAAYHRALALEPENGSAWLFLAEGYTRVGDKVGALRALLKARALNTEDLSIVYQLSEAYLALHDFENAVSLVQGAYRAHPEEVDFLVYIGDIYRLEKQYEASASSYREALAVYPDNVSVLYKLADVLAEDNKPFVAMDILNQILQIKPDFTDAAIFLGNLAFDLRWWERSEAAYSEAAHLGNSEAVFGFRNLSFEAYQRGDIRESVRYLQKAHTYFPDDVSLQTEIAGLEEELKEM
ncbi:MAG: tetratricopeptide repeat protein [Fibrobacter sp.]|jgi:tetratricopeptide (TPR) repeat protein|nr:tetratricopeptide repeat protein [Fibrobacter sp.]